MLIVDESGHKKCFFEVGPIFKGRMPIVDCFIEGVIWGERHYRFDAEMQAKLLLKMLRYFILDY